MTASPWTQPLCSKAASSSSRVVCNTGWSCKLPTFPRDFAITLYASVRFAESISLCSIRAGAPLYVAQRTVATNRIPCGEGRLLSLRRAWWSLLQLSISTSWAKFCPSQSGGMNSKVYMVGVCCVRTRHLVQFSKTKNFVRCCSW